MFWLYLLATVTILAIALRRVKLRQVPLSDESFSRAVAFEHVQSGIAWIENDGKVGSVNASFADIMKIEMKDAIGLEWRELFAAPTDVAESDILDQAYSRMLLAGKETVAVHGRNAFRPEGGAPLEPGLDLLLVAVYDHKMRFVGHHCLVADRRKERALEAQLRELRRNLAEAESMIRLRALEEKALQEKAKAETKPPQGKYEAQLVNAPREKMARRKLSAAALR